jgi:hypothetical protein
MRLVRHQHALLVETAALNEVARHLVLERSEPELPAVLVHAVDDLSAGRDVELQARQRIALAEFQQQRLAVELVDQAVHGEVQRRQRALPDLLDVVERVALLVDHRLCETEQQTRFGEMCTPAHRSAVFNLCSNSRWPGSPPLKRSIALPRG